MIFDWNNEKNMVLKSNRSISFERILVEIDRYVYVVPCVLENDVCFLKTIFPSRKSTAKYLDLKGEENE